MLKNLIKRFRMWSFVHKIGRLPKKYQSLPSEMEKAALLMDAFGTSWNEVLGEGRNK